MPFRAHAGPFHGQLPGQVVEPALGCRVAGDPELPAGARTQYRAEVDDHARMSLGNPPSGGPSGQLVWGHEVHGQLMEEAVEVVVDGWDHPGDSGVVDEDVDAAVVGERGVDQGLWPVVVGDIDRDGQGVG